MKRYFTLLILLIFLAFPCIFLLSSCSSNQKSLVLATTTSVQDSGLLDYLLPQFEKDTGIKVKVIAKGTGEALEIAKRGDADCLLVHSEEQELEFIKEGYGIKRYKVMYNDFVIVGPRSDPSNVKQKAYNDPLKAFELIKNSNSTFISRGDESGTHQREKSLWKKLNVEPDWRNYIVAGLGMGQVLSMANEKKAYTLTDRGTYLSMKDQLDLEIVCEKSPLLINQYSLIMLNPEKIKFKQEEARILIDWFISEKGQKLIGEFGVDKFKQPLFIPNAGR